MNKTKDKIMKEFLENNAYFVDFFNAYFFNGEKVLKPENCMELDSEMNDSNMDLEKHVDVIRSIMMEIFIVHLLLRIKVMWMLQWL